MPHAMLIRTVSLAMCALLVGSSCGQIVATESAESPDKNATANKQVKPEELLRKMSDYLSGLPAFACKVNISIKIEARGQTNEQTTDVILRIERPNKLAVVMTSNPGSSMYSDGKEFVQHLTSSNRYTVGAAPADFATLNESDAALLGNVGQMLPSDGATFYEKIMNGVTGSEYLGLEKINEVECHHLKFLQESANWEIWIEAGKLPLPRRVQPDVSQQLAGQDVKFEYVVSLNDWDVAPKFTEADFKFEPPAGAEKVDSLLDAMQGPEAPHALLGQAAPPFETVDLENKPIDLKSHLGKDVVMLDFWATWCGPCVQAMPQIDGVAKKFADKGLVFYAVNVGEDVDTIKEFLKSSELEVPVAMDQQNNISNLYQANGIPQTVLIGKDGKVQVVHVGFSPRLGDQLTEEVTDLLAGKDLASEALAKAAKAKEGESEEAEIDVDVDESAADDPSTGAEEIEIEVE